MAPLSVPGMSSNPARASLTPDHHGDPQRISLPQTSSHVGARPELTLLSQKASLQEPETDNWCPTQERGSALLPQEGSHQEARVQAQPGAAGTRLTVPAPHGPTAYCAALVDREPPEGRNYGLISISQWVSINVH